MSEHATVREDAKSAYAGCIGRVVDRHHDNLKLVFDHGVMRNRELWFGTKEIVWRPSRTSHA